MKKSEKEVHKYLKEMFKRVGEEYPNPFTEQDDWYTKKSWTEEEQDNFRDWLKKEMKKDNKRWSEKIIKSEVAFFLLMWGWTIKKEGE